ncbi:sec1 family domain-containing protein 2-like [Oncorhynchus kisutch]|uniref:sec1 family domain-containing protein 2-like n=1 Tax=Oncorhynchus kisutch TaxID=8019 RepID=UPI0012DE577E|nr:sec1 family domain-containing protein 2-like [Oncorhynchus kisutch]
MSVLPVLLLFHYHRGRGSRDSDKLCWCGNPEELTMERAHTAVERVFETLKELSHARDHLKQFTPVYTASDGVHQVTCRPFLRQVLEEIFHPDRPGCPDVEHMSGGLTGLLKTGFSEPATPQRPRPALSLPGGRSHSL